MIEVPQLGAFFGGGFPCYRLRKKAGTLILPSLVEDLVIYQLPLLPSLGASNSMHLATNRCLPDEEAQVTGVEGQELRDVCPTVQAQAWPPAHFATSSFNFPANPPWAGARAKAVDRACGTPGSTP